jgi:hypothetical protein
MCNNIEVFELFSEDGLLGVTCIITERPDGTWGYRVLDTTNGSFGSKKTFVAAKKYAIWAAKKHFHYNSVKAQIGRINREIARLKEMIGE